MKKYFEEVDILKGIAIILVIIGHSVIWFPINLHDINWCNYFFEFVSISHMPLFFLVSGFCFSYKNKTYKEHIKSKVFRILIPYIVFSVLDLFPRILLQKFVNRPTNLEDGIRKVFLNGGEYWFLYVIFIIFVIYPIIYKFLISKNKKILNAGLIIVLTSIQFVNFTNIFLINKVMHYLLFFVLGNFIKEYFLELEKIQNKINFKINFILGLIIFSVMIAYIINLKYIENYTILVILAELIGCYFWFLIAKCIIKANNMLKNLFVSCGKYSLQLYLFNGYLLVVSRVLIVNVLKITNPFIIIFANTFIPICVTLLVIKFIINRFNILKFLVRT